jgi:hypothetical protein
MWLLRTCNKYVVWTKHLGVWGLICLSLPPVMADMFNVLEYGHWFLVGLGNETVIKIYIVPVLLIEAFRWVQYMRLPQNMKSSKSYSYV